MERLKVNNLIFLCYYKTIIIFGAHFFIQIEHIINTLNKKMNIIITKSIKLHDKHKGSSNNHQSQQPIIHPTHLDVPVIHEL